MEDSSGAHSMKTMLGLATSSTAIVRRCTQQRGGVAGTQSALGIVHGRRCHPGRQRLEKQVGSGSREAATQQCTG